MPRPRCGATVVAMVRLVIVIAALAAGFVVVKHRLRRGRYLRRGDAAGRRHADSARVPPAAANTPDPARILREPARSRAWERSAGSAAPARELTRGRSRGRSPTSVARRERKKLRGDIRRDLAALNQLTAKGGASMAAAERTLASVYSAPVLAQLGADGRRAFAERVLGRTHVARRIEVVDFAGVFVSGKRALAQVRLPALDPLAVGQVRRPLTADLDRQARPRGRALALRARLRSRLSRASCRCRQGC